MAIELGKKLRIIRKDRCISQKELAEGLKVSQSVVSQWESGEVMPTVENLYGICKILKCSSDLLLGLDGEEN